MKTTFTALLFSILSTLAASAAPLLLVDTVVTDGGEVLSRPKLMVESGKEAAIAVGTLKLTTVATLLKDRTVELRTTLSEPRGKKTDVLTAPRVVAKLGQRAEVQVGKCAFSMVTTVAK